MQTDTLATRAWRALPASACADADPTAPIDRLFSNRSAIQHVRPGGLVLLHGDNADTLYQVVSGTVRCCTIAEDGRRQIFRFARKDDYLGLVDLDTWHFTAEAVDHVIVRSVPRERVDAALAYDAALQKAVRAFTARELAARERQLIMLAYMPAEQRLKHFLLDLAASRNTDGFVVLAMTRQDIGDHLGLTLETVSRAFSALRRKGIIEMRGAERFRMTGEQISLAA